MPEQSSKAKYAKFLRSPKWNEAVFSSENYLVTMTNLDEKDEKSFFHKQQQTLLDFDWVASPEVGTLLCGTRSGSDLIDIKFLEKPDDKWVINETKTKEAESRFKEHSLISIHTTADECLPLYTLSQKLAEHKIVIDTGAGFLVDISKDSNFDKEKFSTAFDKLALFLLSDPSKIFDDFQEEDEESHSILERMGCESNLITKTALRKGKWAIPGVDNVPNWSTLSYTKPGAVDEAGRGSGSPRNKSVTPKDKINALVELLADGGSLLQPLQAASTSLGYTLTPSELLSVAVAASTGVYVPFYRVPSSEEYQKLADAAKTVAKIEEAVTETIQPEEGSDKHLDLFNQVKSHPKWDPKSPKIKKMMNLEYDSDPSDLHELDQTTLHALLIDLDSL